MKIGYSVEGSTDRALLKGLQLRWCPDAELIKGEFRGSTNLSLRREYQKICDEFVERSVDVMVFLTDADDEPWRDAQRRERESFPQNRLNFAIHGVADRNVECWICKDSGWLAARLKAEPTKFEDANPKAAFEIAMGIDRDNRREAEVAELVRQAPLRNWLANPSFEDFYDQIRAKSQMLDCFVENLREGATA